MEEKRDHHSLGSGKHFTIPFDVMLVFSTNLNPLDLADDAFLRRIGYKIKFDYLTPNEYGLIWRDVCREKNVPFEPEVLQFAVKELHQARGVPLLPCHPRDLLGMAIDKVVYDDEPRRVTPDSLRWAWKNYFVSLSE